MEKVRIECNRLFDAISKVEENYNKILEASYKNIAPQILANMRDNIIEFENNNSEKHYRIGECFITPKGIIFYSGSIFSRKKKFLDWKNVIITNHNGEALILDKREFDYSKESNNMNVLVRISLREEWNACLLEQIKIIFENIGIFQD